MPRTSADVDHPPVAREVVDFEDTGDLRVDLAIIASSKIRASSGLPSSWLHMVPSPAAGSPVRTMCDMCSGNRQFLIVAVLRTYGRNDVGWFEASRRDGAVCDTRPSASPPSSLKMPRDARSRITRARGSAFAPTRSATVAIGIDSSPMTSATPSSATTCSARAMKCPSLISCSKSVVCMSSMETPSCAQQWTLLFMGPDPNESDLSDRFSCVS